MNSKSPLFFLFSIIFFFSSATSFNITKILDQYPNLSTFNGYLTETEVAKEINSRTTITVLAVANDAISGLSGKHTDIIKRVVSLHVVLDYYDTDKLQHLSNKTALLTTLFQTSGSATGKLGFLNVTLLTTGEVAFGSAVPTASFSGSLVKSVASEPYNISVLQISNVIIPPGIDNLNSTSLPSRESAATPSSSPSSASSPTPATSASSPSGSASSPSNASSSSDGSAPGPETQPQTPVSDARAPGPAAGETADASSQSPSSNVAEGPGLTGDSPVADNGGAPGPSEEAPTSFGTRVVSGTCIALLIGFVSIAAL